MLGSNQLYRGVKTADNVYKECTVLFSLAQNLLTLTLKRKIDQVLAKYYL
jgi:hypothetical protein